MANKSFSLIHAQAAAALDGTEVEFTGRNTLEYRTPSRFIILPVDTYIADDGAPDGVVVEGEPGLRWSDGRPLLEPEFKNIMDDLAAAAGPLKTVFRWPQR